MMFRIRSLVLLGLGGLVLSSCGSGNSSNNSSPPPTPVAKVETQFGSCFATRYEADRYSKATDPVPCPDLAPLTLSTKPARL